MICTYLKLAGKPDIKTAHRLEHDFHYTHTLTDDELAAMLERGRNNAYPAASPEDLRHWDVSITLNAVFKQDQLASLTVDRVETN